MFVDRIKVLAKAGDGGRGCVSFRREKYVPKGGPDGGDGGRGGDIILHADPHTDHLSNLYYEPLIKAKSGSHGMGKKMHGRGAEDKIVNVPVGTIVYRAPYEAPHDPAALVDPEPTPRVSDLRELELVADLAAPGQEFILCKGGKGGKGNVHFKSSRNRAPIQYTEGEEGEESRFYLELRMIADAGLVGYPNAGKSTLLSRISSAHPKIASYAFTTLHPSIGVVELGEYRRITIADIPGLIEGAHKNLGLGHDFLRHITRCPVLLFVLDMAGSEGRDPVEDLQSLRRELNLYDETLSKRPWFVVANKMDLADADEHLAAFRQRFPEVEVLPMSADRGGGIAELRELLKRTLPESIAAETVPAATASLDFTRDEDVVAHAEP